MKNKNFTLIAIFLSFILVSCSGEETKQTIKDSAVGGVYAEYLFVILVRTCLKNPSKDF